MKKLRYYIVLCRRHRKFGGWRQALSFAWAHKAFWNGCEGEDGDDYQHIGRRSV